MIEYGQVGGSPLTGVKAVAVSLEIYPIDESFFTWERRLQERIEHTLRDAGIQVVDYAVGKDDPSAGQLSMVICIERLIVGSGIEAGSTIEVYAVVVEATHQENVFLCRNQNIRILTRTWSTWPGPTLMVLPSATLEMHVTRILDAKVARFVEEYRTANHQPHAYCSV